MIYGSGKILQATRRRTDNFSSVSAHPYGRKSRMLHINCNFTWDLPVFYILFFSVLYAQVLLQTVVSNLSVSNALFLCVQRLRNGKHFFHSIVLWEHQQKSFFSAAKTPTTIWNCINKKQQRRRERKKWRIIKATLLVFT